MGARTEYNRNYYRANPRINASLTPQQLERKRQRLRISFRRWRLAKRQTIGRVAVNKPLEKFLKDEIKSFGLQSYFANCHREKTTINTSPSLLEFDNL